MPLAAGASDLLGRRGPGFRKLGTQTVAAALTTYVSISGLGLDILGAALLAYDVLRGPEARLQAAVRENRLAWEIQALERSRAQLKALLKEPNPPDKKMRWLRGRIGAISKATESTRAELEHSRVTTCGRGESRSRAWWR